MARELWNLEKGESNHEGLTSEQIITAYGSESRVKDKPTYRNQLRKMWGGAEHQPFNPKQAEAVKSFDVRKVAAKAAELNASLAGLPEHMQASVQSVINKQINDLENKLSVQKQMMLVLDAAKPFDNTTQQKLAGQQDLNAKLAALPEKPPSASNSNIGPNGEMNDVISYLPATVERRGVAGPQQREGDFAIVRLMADVNDRKKPKFYYEAETLLNRLPRSGALAVSEEKFDGIVVEAKIKIKFGNDMVDQKEMITIPKYVFRDKEGDIGREILVELVQQKLLRKEGGVEMPTFSGKHIHYKKENGTIILEDKGTNTFLMHVKTTVG